MIKIHGEKTSLPLPQEVMVMPYPHRPIRGNRGFHLRTITKMTARGWNPQENFILRIDNHLGLSLQLGIWLACMKGNQSSPMKNTSLLFLASLAVLASSASAAQSQSASELIVLPTYIVSAPRYSAAEQQINASLSELRRQAHVVPVIITELPMRKALFAQQSSLATAATSGLLAKS